MSNLHAVPFATTDYDNRLPKYVSAGAKFPVFISGVGDNELK